MNFKQQIQLIKHSRFCPFKILRLATPADNSEYQALVRQYRRTNPKFRNLWNKAQDWAYRENDARTAASNAVKAAPDEFQKTCDRRLVAHDRSRLYRDLERYYLTHKTPVGFGKDNVQ